MAELCFELRLAPEPDALVRVLTMLAVRQAQITDLRHARGFATRLYIEGLDQPTAETVRRRLEGMPCVEAVTVFAEPTREGFPAASQVAA